MKKIKFTWGTGIVIAIFIFVSFFVTIIILSTTQKINFVTKDYYSEGVKYEQMIEKHRNTKSLKGQFSVTYNSNKLSVSFPSDFYSKNITGTLQLYYITNYKRDHTYVIELDSLTQHIDMTAMPAGRYIVKINCSDGEREYYYEMKEGFIKQ